jgi:hemoglobin
MPPESRIPSEPSSLYEHLGGWGGIAIVAELWCDRVLADPRLAEYFVNVNAGDLKKAQTEFLVHLAGGPVRSPLQPLPPLYAQVPVSAWYSERLAGHLIAALVWANVSRPYIEETLDALGSMVAHTRPAGSPPDKDQDKKG